MGGGARYRTTTRRTGWAGTGTHREPTNETTREDRAGTAGRKTDDSGAERTRHSPHVRPPPLRRRPRPSTAMPPTHVKQYTDKARPGRDRIPTPRSGRKRYCAGSATFRPASRSGLDKIVTLAIQTRAKAEEPALRDREREVADRRSRSTSANSATGRAGRVRSRPGGRRAAAAARGSTGTLAIRSAARPRSASTASPA